LTLVLTLNSAVSLPVQGDEVFGTNNKTLINSQQVQNNTFSDIEMPSFKMIHDVHI